tara:strand:- start:5233 stop:5676 length:444 start_codon:yes stop_codon:yes gene_type:complete
MSKKQNWENSLAWFLDSKVGAKFEWGKNDCLHFMLNAVEAMTGKQPWQSPGASTAYEAARWLEKLGGLEALFRCIAKNNKWSAVINPERNAQRGDVVLIKDQGRLSCGVAGLGVAVCPGEHRLQSVPVSQVVAAFRIPTEEKELCPR